MTNLDDRDTEDENEPSETHAIRGAFVARHGQHHNPPAGGAGDAGPDTLRGAYVSRLVRETVRKAGDVTSGTEDLGNALVRGFYAARRVVEDVVTTLAPAPRRAAARPKAKAKAKAKPAPKAKAKAPAKAKAKAPARAAAKKKAPPPRRAAKKSRGRR